MKSSAQAAPPSFVYVIKSASGQVKIGIAADPLAELSRLQRVSPDTLDLVYAAAVQSNDGYAIEQAAHGILWARRTSEEWFNALPEVAVGAIAAASHRLKDPIVEIPIDKLRLVLAIAAKEQGRQSPGSEHKRTWPLLWFGTAPVPILWGLAALQADGSPAILFTGWLVVALPWALIAYWALRLYRSS